VPIHVRVWLGLGSKESNSPVCGVSQAGLWWIINTHIYFRVCLPSQTRMHMGTFRVMPQERFKNNSPHLGPQLQKTRIINHVIHKAFYPLATVQFPTPLS
jgi:hypothetical protein